MNAPDIFIKVRNSRLLKNIGVYTLGNIIQKSAEFLLLPLWARFLTPTDYGIVGILTSYIGVILPFLGLGLQAYVTYMYYQFEQDRDKLRSAIFSIGLFQLVFSLSLTLLMVAFGRGFWSLITKSDIGFSPFAELMLLIVFFEGVNAIPMALYQVRQKANIYISLQLAIFALNVIFSLIFIVVLKMGAYGKMLATLLPYALVGTANALVMLRRYATIHVDWGRIRDGIKYGAPLIPHQLSGWALNAADRLILEKFVALSAIGIYNLGYQIGLVLNMIVNAINLAWMPHYFQTMNQGRDVHRQLIRELSFYITAIGAICLFGILFNFEGIRLLLPEKFYASASYVPPVLLGYFFVGLNKFAMAPFYFYKKTRIVPLITMLSAAFNIGMNILLIPRYGALASAWMTAASYGLICFVSFWVSHRYQQTPYPYPKFALYCLMLIGVALLVTRFNDLSLLTVLIKIGILLAAGGLSYLLFLKDAGVDKKPIAVS